MPFGRGRRWGGNANAIVNRIIGGWQLGVASKIQSGRLVDIGNVRLNGMSRADVQKAFNLRFDNTGKQIYMWPDDIVQNTILAFATSATTASGYAGTAPAGRYFSPPNGPDCIEVAQTGTLTGKGDCGTGTLVLTGPTFKAHDIRFSKRTDVVGRVNIEFAAELLNAFNHPNFTPVNGIGSSTVAGYQLTGLTGTDTRRTVQLVARVNW